MEDPWGSFGEPVELARKLLGFTDRKALAAFMSC